MGEYAFPSSDFDQRHGMTLRDYFAAHAPAMPDSYSCGRQVRVIPTCPSDYDYFLENREAFGGEESIFHHFTWHRDSDTLKFSKVPDAAIDGLNALRKLQEDTTDDLAAWRREQVAYEAACWAYAYADAMLSVRGIINPEVAA